MATAEKSATDTPTMSATATPVFDCPKFDLPRNQAQPEPAQERRAIGFHSAGQTEQSPDKLPGNFVLPSTGQTGQTGECETKTKRTNFVRAKGGQTGQKSGADLSGLSKAERERYVRYKNRLVNGKLGPKAKEWFDQVSKNRKA
jgi:hypothetical protein